jgi:hypothetical protein
MIYGNYDDRNDARVNVKGWLRNNDAASYTSEEIRRLVIDAIKADRDPVDPIADSWREGSYGALVGLVEFAQEEMEQHQPETIRSFDGSSESIENGIRERGVKAALDRVVTMRGLLAGKTASCPHTHRADQALKLAEDMMTFSMARADAISSEAA